MLLSTFYVISFPTLMAAMTGYIATYKPYVEDSDQNLLEWSQVKQVAYIINDAHRLNGFDGPLIATTDDEPLVRAIGDRTFIERILASQLTYYRLQSVPKLDFYTGTERHACSYFRL
jgi:hypothetical protein